MAGKKLNKDDLIALGFESVATWAPMGAWLEYRIHPERKQKASVLLAAGNALYAFCADTEVLYVGKTAQTLKKRFKGYCKPGSTQSTNQKCHARIKAALADGRSIDILAFAPPDDLQFRGFAINLAGGLEDILIRTFAPPWNGSAKGGARSESAQREIEQEADGLASGAASETLEAEKTPEIGRFVIPLTPTYYNKGIINPGRAVSDLFGPDNDLLTVCFSDGTPSITTRIDRRANRNGSVRFIGSNQAIAAWFQTHFDPGEVVTARILGPNGVELVGNDI